MIAILLAIAALCQVPNGAVSVFTLSKMSKAQLSCQQYYVSCLEAQGQWTKPKESRVKLINAGMLAQCIQVRKIK